MPLSISHLFSTNDVPSASEAVSIQRMVGDLTSQLHDIQPRLEQLKNVLSPVRRVPPEVIGEILWLALPDHAESKGLDEEDRKYLLDLCRVSKIWREAVRSTHRLWAYASITLEGVDGAEEDDDYDGDSGDDDEDNGGEEGTEDDDKGNKGGYIEHTLSGIKAWFDHAGTLPKTLGVCIRHEGPELGETCQEYCPAAFPQLASFILEENWGHLKLTLPSIICFEVLTDAINGHPQKAAWESLHSLTIATDDWALNHRDYLYGFHPFGVLPPVTILSLQSPNYAPPCGLETGDIFPLNLERLVSLHLDVVWFEDQVVDLLLSCKNLEICCLSFTQPIPEGCVWQYNEPELASDGNYGRITLPRLHTLQLNAIYPTDALRRLILPSLRSLTVTLNCPRFTAHYLKNSESIPLFIRRSQCQLETLHLSLSILGFSDIHLLKLLSDLPSVVHLTLDRAHIDGWMFRRMNSPEEVVLPKLETIRLTQMPSSLRVAKFSDFVRSREREKRDRVALKEASATYCEMPSNVAFFQGRPYL